MKKNEQILKAQTAAKDYFETGFHCAESVVASVLEAMDDECPEAISHATAFGGGFGKTFTETCGALSGAMIVIGHLYGRENRGEGWDLPANLGAQIRDFFIKQFQTTHCETLRQRFGEEQHNKCKALTGQIAAQLLSILIDESEKLEH